MVRNPPPGPDNREFQMVGVDCSIIMNPKVWEASGHATGFADPMVDCKACKARFRADQLLFLELIFPDVPESEKQNFLICGSGSASEILEANAKKVEKLRHAKGSFTTLSGARAYTELSEQGRKEYECPECREKGQLTDPRAFNLMFRTTVGALDLIQELSDLVGVTYLGPKLAGTMQVQDVLARLKDTQAYLRPETAQGIFANFKNVMDSTRVKIPFGIAQVGKAFRNEINPRNFTFRSREFEQMEIEFFCHPSESRMWYEYWRDVRKAWYTSLGIKSDKLRPREQGKEELAHYSCGTTDIEYLFPFSDEPQELEGVAHRGDFDLKAHGKHSRGDENAFAVLVEETKERFVPHVIEPSAGADRFTLAVICEAYSYDESRASPEFMKFHPRLAPIKAAVFPLVAKDGLPEIAEPIFREIKKHFPCQYDAKQSIGKRYARMDEAGTPFCFTIDGQSKEDGTVTVRNRDDASQIRIDKSRCLEYLRDQLHL